jgi:hypothetical protein
MVAGCRAARHGRSLPPAPPPRVAAGRCTPCDSWLGLKRVEDILGGVRDSLPLIELEGSLDARVKRALAASMFNGTAHRGFDKLAERLAVGEHGVERSAQLRFDTDLGNDSAFHGRSVVRLFYSPRPGFRRGRQVRPVPQSRPNRCEHSGGACWSRHRHGDDRCVRKGLRGDPAAQARCLLNNCLNRRA